MIFGSCHFLRHQFTQRDEPDQIIADMDALTALYNRCKANGITVVFSHVNEQPMNAIRHAGFNTLVGEENFCAHIDDALLRAEALVGENVQA